MEVTEGIETDFSSRCTARGQEAIVTSCSKEKLNYKKRIFSQLKREKAVKQVPREGCGISAFGDTQNLDGLLVLGNLIRL